MSDLEAALAVHRFGLGARPGERARIAADPRGWLTAQVVDAAAFRLDATGLPTVRDAGAAFVAFQAGVEEARRAPPADPAPVAETAMSDVPEAARPRDPLVEAVVLDVEARTRHALATPHGYAERLVHFWSNHFTVAATKPSVVPFVGVFEREVVRGNLVRRFEDLLLAAVAHPAMLLYLDQAQSAGPGSVAGQRRDLGLNENLAREILELHTLGVNGGYTQQDVGELARALTGWTVVGPRLQRFLPEGAPGDSVFVDALHEPGARKVLGRVHPEGGRAQAEGILRQLAAHPSTARHLSEKLVRQVMGREPAAGAVARVERVWRRTDGDLVAVHRALVEVTEAWDPTPGRRKTPTELMVSTLRALDVPSVDRRGIIATHALLGQPPYRAPSPAGWADDDASWGGADALRKRLLWCEGVVARFAPRARPEDLLTASLGPLLPDDTATAVRRAASASQGLVLGLMSPTFQRR